MREQQGGKKAVKKEKNLGNAPSRGAFPVRLRLGGRGGIRTRDLWLRRPTLYPAELPARVLV
jgi:hypothetical protein